MGSGVENTADGFFRLGEAHSLNTILTHAYSTTTGKSGFAGAAQYFSTPLTK